jgi:hypothetical protein
VYAQIAGPLMLLLLVLVPCTVCQRTPEDHRHILSEKNMKRLMFENVAGIQETYQTTKMFLLLVSLWLRTKISPPENMFQFTYSVMSACIVIQWEKDILISYYGNV